MSFPYSVLKAGKNSSTNKPERIKDMEHKMNASHKNWNTSWFLDAPTVLRKPTSLALFVERAVLRFTKFIHANKRIIIPVTENIFT